MRAAYRASGALLDKETMSRSSTPSPPSKRPIRRNRLTPLMTTIFSPSSLSFFCHTHLRPSKAARWLLKRWSVLLLTACVLAFVGVAAFASALTNNYTCVGGEHIASGYDSPWSIAMRWCSGNQMHARRDIVSINGPAPYPSGMAVIVPSSGG